MRACQSHNPDPLEESIRGAFARERDGQTTSGTYRSGYIEGWLEQLEHHAGESAFQTRPDSRTVSAGCRLGVSSARGAGQRGRRSTYRPRSARARPSGKPTWPQPPMIKTSSGRVMSRARERSWDVRREERARFVRRGAARRRRSSRLARRPRRCQGRRGSPRRPGGTLHERSRR